MVVITAATVLANMAVMVALWRARRAPSHYPLISLVSADLLVGISVLPIAALRDLFVFNLHRVICACWSTLDVLCCTASILSLGVLAWERWSGITAPLARARRARRARVLAVLVWPVATMVALPAAFVPSPRHFHPGELEKACTVNINTWYVFISITFSFYLPAGVVVALYGFILRALSSHPPIRAHRGRTPSPRCQKQNSERSNAVLQFVTTNLPPKTDNNQNFTADEPAKTCRFEGSKSHRGCTEPGTGKCRSKRIREALGMDGYWTILRKAIHDLARLATHDSDLFLSDSSSHLTDFQKKISFMQRQRRATRTIVMLIALFLVCWTPYFVILPLDSLYDIVRDTTWQWCTWLGYINSALNPFVYAVASPSVRRALQHSYATSSSKNNDIPLTPRLQRNA